LANRGYIALRCGIELVGVNKGIDAVIFILARAAQHRAKHFDSIRAGCYVTTFGNTRNSCCAVDHWTKVVHTVIDGILLADRRAPMKSHPDGQTTVDELALWTCVTIVSMSLVLSNFRTNYLP
jgi:hypothetical protein